ncbi:hypothetical protein CVR96_27385, partial [Salmonella enterica subsp. enterica serovar Typhimurium]|uniref:hypothetical protein n=1 Tax=Salmonella enterica TaxID=28901 RepID=UPI000CC8EAB7
NILASIRYTEARYGSLLAGWQGTGYSTGGTVPYGQRILVGEKGPEIMDVPAQTKVHSNADSRRMMSSGGVNIEEININGHNLTVDEIVNELMRMLKLKLANM